MKFPRCPIRTKCLTQARKEAKVMYPKCTGEDIYRYVQDVSRRVIQARLGVQLQRGAKWRLLPEDQSETKRVVSKNNKLQMNKTANVMTLTGLKIFPSVGEQSGETTVGTLEGHLNGFSYSTFGPNFRFHFLYRNVKNAFFRNEDEKMLPLLHFHLHHPIKVGAEKRQDVQFHLVQTPVGQRRSYNDSDKIVGPNNDLKNFVDKVQAKWSHVPVLRCCYPFAGAELHNKDEFQGNLPSKVPTIFALNFFSLVGLVDEPFVVVDLCDIEIVNLARLKPGVVDMTIVLRDFKRDPVRINSIPLDSLNLIKDRFNFAKVKYFENCKDLNWDSIVKERADSPGKFYANKGWFSYGLEDLATASLYKHYYAVPEVNCYAQLEYEDEGEESDTLEN